MGLLGTLKNKLGIGGVSIDFSVPPQIEKNKGSFDGKVTLTTKSEQEVVKMEAILKEEFSTGIGDNKSSKVLELGKWTSFDTFSIAPGEVKTFDFTVEFSEMKSNMDKLSDKGGVMGGLGKGLKFMNQEKSKFFVEVNVDVKAAMLDPSEKKDVQLV